MNELQLSWCCVVIVCSLWMCKSQSYHFSFQTQHLKCIPKSWRISREACPSLTWYATAYYQYSPFFICITLCLILSTLNYLTVFQALSSCLMLADGKTVVCSSWDNNVYVYTFDQIFLCRLHTHSHAPFSPGISTPYRTAGDKTH